MTVHDDDAPAAAPEHCAHCPLRTLTPYGGIHADESRTLIGMRNRTRRVPANTDVFATGDAPSEVATLFSGWAFRYVVLADSARQILSFVLPGETIGLSTLPGEPMSHAVRSLTPCTFCFLDKAALRDYLWYDHDACQQVFRYTVRRREDLERQVALLGRRLARPRVAALLTDLHDRLRQIGQSVEGDFPFPLRHGHVADATGLTPIHVSRVFRDLESERLIRRVSRRIKVLDEARLRALAGASERDAGRSATH
jgi:CRP-like cAMP-binding protein